MTARARLAREVNTARRMLTEETAIGPPRPRKPMQYEIWLHPIKAEWAKLRGGWAKVRLPWRIGRYATLRDAENAMHHYKTHNYYVRYYSAEMRALMRNENQTNDGVKPL